MARQKIVLATTVLAALALAMPMAARDAAAKNSKSTTTTMAAKNSKSTTTTMDILYPTSLSGKAIKPGNYRITVDDAKVTIEQNGKVVAEAAVQWKDEPSKAKYSTLVTDERGVREIHFDGKTRYVEIAE